MGDQAHVCKVGCAWRVGVRQRPTIQLNRVRRIFKEMGFRTHHIIPTLPTIEWESCKTVIYQGQKSWPIRIPGFPRLAQHTHRKNRHQPSATVPWSLPTTRALLQPQYSTEEDTQAINQQKKCQELYYNRQTKPLTPLTSVDTVRLRLPGEKTWSAVGPRSGTAVK